MYRIQFPDGLGDEEKRKSLVDALARLYLEESERERAERNKEADLDEQLDEVDFINEWIDAGGGFDLDGKILERMIALVECPDSAIPF